ncbi:ectonucleotide pyrophosphatase/phosphodiesterase family member 3-like [Dendronephthya gigantea]|uniref:ectonucleotide pyrophosphatase/phosphodiesterase family member 3-like n=1 Tax=Dendronephthya gigantea TaxID=151771 RepID=UPI0010694E5B|nr:ectonucleotide pyrophosphatase/phosphodiesterase family member 3-like [Dendronephthya gigantea]
MKVITTIFLCVFLLSFIIRDVLCASIPVTASPRPPMPKGFGTAKRAIIIGIDGLGGSYLRNVTEHYHTFRSFFEQGSYTTRARGVFPTKSGPNWSSYLTGMNVMEHGVFDNDWTVLTNGDPENETTYSIPPVSGRGRPETIFTQVKRKDPNLQTAMMFTWAWLKNYAINNTDVDVWSCGSDNVQCTGDVINCYNNKDMNTAFAVKENLLKNDPILTFVHFDQLDAAGHYSYWGSPGYYSSLASVDLKIKYLINALNDNNDSSGKQMLSETMIVIVADHGGWRSSHGFGFKPFSALIDIPVLIRGPGVLRNNSLEDTYVSNLDVAVTVLNAIGVEKSKFMKGQVLEQIYA